MGRFFRTLSSSYVLLLAASAYSLGVVPMILTYTDTRSLGLWSLVVQFGTYLALLDAGLSGACIRQFVGPIVRKDSDALASKFQNALALASAQGFLIAITGLAGASRSLVVYPHRAGPALCRPFRCSMLPDGSGVPCPSFQFAFVGPTEIRI